MDKRSGVVGGMKETTDLVDVGWERNCVNQVV